MGTEGGGRGLDFLLKVRKIKESSFKLQISPGGTGKIKNYDVIFRLSKINIRGKVEGTNKERFHRRISAENATLNGP